MLLHHNIGQKNMNFTRQFKGVCVCVCVCRRGGGGRGKKGESKVWSLSLRRFHNVYLSVILNCWPLDLMMILYRKSDVVRLIQKELVF